jgi:hypothetical protein
MTNPSLMSFLTTILADRDFVHVRAALKSNHPLVTRHRVQQIRKPKGILAEGWDVLGNRTVLTTDNRVIQLIGSEKL